MLRTWFRNKLLQVIYLAEGFRGFQIRLGYGLKSPNITVFLLWKNAILCLSGGKKWKFFGKCCIHIK